MVKPEIDQPVIFTLNINRPVLGHLEPHCSFDGPGYVRENGAMSVAFFLEVADPTVPLKRSAIYREIAVRILAEAERLERVGK